MACVCEEGWAEAGCSQCASGYFGHNCTQCECGSHSTCNDGMSGNGTCVCEEGWAGGECSECASGYFGHSCTQCECGSHFTCNDGMSGDGTCVCEEGWTGEDCDCLFNSSMLSCSINAGGGYSWTTQAQQSPIKVVDAGGSAGDQLGRGGPCLSANGLVLAAASPADDDKGLYSGSITVWERGSVSDSFNDAEGVKLVDPNGQVGDALGAGGVALSETGLILVAAAHGNDEKGTNTGCVLVWQRSTLSTSFYAVEVERLHRQDASSVGSGLGQGGVAISADGLVVAATSPNDDSSSGVTDVGSVTVWERSNLSTPLSAITPFTLTDSSGVASDRLGAGGPSLSADGAVLAVGGYGFVMVWDRSTSSTPASSLRGATPVKLTQQNPVESDKLGIGGPSLSADGLVLAAGAPGHGDSGTQYGAVWVWTRQDQSEAFSPSTTHIMLTDPTGGDQDELGYGGPALSADGLVLAAAAHNNNGKAFKSGAVLVWQRASTTASFSSVTPAKLTDPTGSAYDVLGQGGVSLSADGRVLAASSLADDKGVDSGSTLVWENVCEGGHSPPLCH